MLHQLTNPLGNRSFIFLIINLNLSWLRIYICNSWLINNYVRVCLWVLSIFLAILCIICVRIFWWCHYSIVRISHYHCAILDIHVVHCLALSSIQYNHLKSFLACSCVIYDVIIEIAVIFILPHYLDWGPYFISIIYLDRTLLSIRNLWWWLFSQYLTCFFVKRGMSFEKPIVLYILKTFTICDFSYVVVLLEASIEWEYSAWCHFYWLL